MGVHGLNSILSNSGLADPSSRQNQEIPPLSILAIDGDGLIFHLIRLSYHQWLTSLEETNQLPQSNLAAVLPTFLPLEKAHKVTMSYLSALCMGFTIRLDIYFDGPDQVMKGHERRRRRLQREREWEDVWTLCEKGVLPRNCDIGTQSHSTSKFRSSARKQQQQLSNNSNEKGNIEALTDAFLGCFPLSKLLLEQIHRSILKFALDNPDCTQIIDCDGEADVMVARASASDVTGHTYAIGNDTDYLVYGFPLNEDQEEQCEVQYIPFHQLDFSSQDVLGASILTRSSLCSSIGLPNAAAMTELSILLGNDYTGPFLRHSNIPKRKVYRESLRWYRRSKSDGAEYIALADLDRSDTMEMVDHITNHIEGEYVLTSTIKELKLAIDFSYKLYSFQDITAFPMRAPGAEEDADDGEDTKPRVPSLPRGLNITEDEVGDSGVDTDSVIDAAMRPLYQYLSTMAGETSNEGDDIVIEQRHIDAFRATLKSANSDSSRRSLPRQVHWNDVRVAYVMEKCLLAAIDDETLPYKFFDHSTFLSLVDSLTQFDFHLDNGVVSQDDDATPEEMPTNNAEVSPTKHALPIDEYENEILQAIKSQRVTIIHGETGCGKSSRVPAMLLRAPPPEKTDTATEVKMIISQPRRIAAKSLAMRIRDFEPDLRGKIALRMGHGVREYETSETRAWFVTTGYCVRLLANHREWFDSHTHLIIDEVHERSVDTDVLCLLCRRLLNSHPTIRLVLMSATIAAELYSQYFGAPEPPIHVAARRYPIQEYFVEDLATLLHLSRENAKSANAIFQNCAKTRCMTTPSNQLMGHLYELATQITLSVGSHGSSVLIFVPGMNDIEAISEKIESLVIPDITFSCLPIHSDIPFDEQMEAFKPPLPGFVKVVIATNAAESSVTLPDVDHVICLGLCKQIVYNEASHRQMLQPCWISRASAKQRAGRTGRVRPGSVYRLYSRSAYESYMAPFETGEMARMPLDSVILSLREMLSEEVTPILLDCLEAPDISTIERSFKSLYDSNFISAPDDQGDITSLGSLVVALGIDLSLGALVGLGIQFGLAAEAIQMAAIVAFPKTPWSMTSPMYHETDQFNDITCKTFVSRCYFDNGHYSEPLGIMNLLWDFKQSEEKHRFCSKNAVSLTRLKHLASTVTSLQQRLANSLGVPVTNLEIEKPPYLMPHAKVVFLRILQVWLFHESLICQVSKSGFGGPDGSAMIQLTGPAINEKHLSQVLMTSRHPHQLLNLGGAVQTGTFISEEWYTNGEDEYFRTFENSFVSYVIENEFDVAFFCEESIHLFVPLELWEKSEELRDILTNEMQFDVEHVTFAQSTSDNRRGRRGRSCGIWSRQADGATGSNERQKMKRLLHCSGYVTKSETRSFVKFFHKNLIDIFSDPRKLLSCCMQETKRGNDKVNFTINMSGDCREISQTDLNDLFGVPDMIAHTSKKPSSQVLRFEATNSLDGDSCPLLQDLPEGARLVSVLAGSRRRETFIRFIDKPEIDVNVPKAIANIAVRWRRKDTGGQVFVPSNSVPSAVIPAEGETEMYAVCANTLELQGGGLRVEGMSLLPPGRLFLGLSLLTFGIDPQMSFATDSLYDDSDSICKKAARWICETDGSFRPNEVKHRVERALDFHRSSMSLGETLACYPDKIRELCSIFDGVDGYPTEAWEGLEATQENYRSCPTARKARNRVSHDRKDKSTDLSEKQKMITDEKETGSSEQNEAAPVDVPNAPQDRKTQLYTCPKCQKSWSQKKKFRKHMQSCCPQEVEDKNAEKGNDIRTLTEKDREKYYKCACGEEVPGFDRFLGHARICCPQLASSDQWRNQIKAGAVVSNGPKVSQADIKPIEQTPSQKAKKAKPIKKQNTETRSYSCPECKVSYSKWNKCVGHMQSCCPSVVPDLEKCLVLKEKKDRKAKKENSPNTTLMYACQECPSVWAKWKLCQQHIKTCHSEPSNPICKKYKVRLSDSDLRQFERRTDPALGSYFVKIDE